MTNKPILRTCSKCSTEETLDVPSHPKLSLEERKLWHNLDYWIRTFDNKGYFTLADACAAEAHLFGGKGHNLPPVKQLKALEKEYIITETAHGFRMLYAPCGHCPHSFKLDDSECLP